MKHLVSNPYVASVLTASLMAAFIFTGQAITRSKPAAPAPQALTTEQVTELTIAKFSSQPVVPAQQPLTTEQITEQIFAKLRSQPVAPAPKPAAPAPQPLTTEQIIANTEAATVLITDIAIVPVTSADGKPVMGADGKPVMKPERGSGSGWFFDNHGDIMTANHVANDTNTSVVVTLPNGKKLNAVLVYEPQSASGTDFSVLHVDVTGNKFLKFGEFRQARGWQQDYCRWLSVWS